MKGKGKQFVPHGRRVMMAFPGGAGYGAPSERARDEVMRDLVLGYISEDAARDVYGLDEEAIAEARERAGRGEAV